MEKENERLLSCSEVKSSQQLRQKIKEELSDGLKYLVTHYNLSAQQIFDDFILNNDSEAYKKAQSIVKGLKSAYQYQAVIESTYPAATYYRVMVYQGSEIDNNNAYPDAWYREWSVWYPSGYRYRLEKMTDNLSSVARVIYDRAEEELITATGKLLETSDVFSYSGDNTAYRCSYQEKLTITEAEIDYSISNSVESSAVSDYEACAKVSFDDGDWRYYEINYIDEGINYYIRFDIQKDDDEHKTLNHWKNLRSSAGSLVKEELISHFKTFGYRFEQAVTLVAYSWSKRMTDTRNDGYIQVDKYSNGQWVKLIYENNGTYKQTCSFDGVNWNACNE